MVLKFPELAIVTDLVVLFATTFTSTSAIKRLSVIGSISRLCYDEGEKLLEL
ncbi:hypothetical protein FHR92_001118 [Fontibacillus solani]|uniref:Uncharacterized protein n=1 Tax=Fontibacillus solani TaxID=1572857 RepID=A0A7W3SR15_9BACL|nr:hypothetical protein [Fontibacillus solani]MBA9084657.1 hypothetical protein [Fontibacillus solani]